jgi:photosystem II stability/assembly factor-like uncharacterized protein
MKTVKGNSKIKRSHCVKNWIAREAGLVLVLVGLMIVAIPMLEPITLAQPVGQTSVNTWSSSGPEGSIQSLAIDPGDPSTIYAGSKRGVFKSTDGGASWSNTGLSADTRSLVIDSVNSNVLYAGTCAEAGVTVFYPGSPFLFKSTDGGATWSNTSSPLDFDMSLLVMDPTSPNTLYAGSLIQYVGSGGIILWKSTDGGATWNGERTGDIGLASYGLTIDPANPQILYAPGDLYANTNLIHSGLFKSVDGGMNWSATGLKDDRVAAVAIDPVNPNTLYAGTLDHGQASANPRGVFKSTDSGASWFAINNGLSDLIGSPSTVAALVINPNNPNTLYAATSGSGVFRSTDGGANWVPFNDGLTNLNVTALVIAPSHPDTLYAGTSDGVFEIIDTTPVPPVAIPKIIGATVAGKKLIVLGENFYPRAAILINGEEQITRNDDQSPQGALIGKKAGKKIKPGDRLQVRNPNGSMSEEFVFTGP